jgi:replicative DNA helicase
MTPTHENATPRLYKLGDLLQDFAADASSAHQAYLTGQARGPVSRFAWLDETISGAFSPGLHMLHGGPGTGKTALALQIAATCGCPALFVSCEISPIELLRRMAARVTGTYLGRFKTGELDESQAIALARRACEAAPDLAIVDGQAGFPSPDWLYARAAEVRGEARDILLVIDSLHSWAHGAGGDISEYDALNAGIRALGGLTASLRCPALVIAERNRANMQKGGMNAGAGSRRIEYVGETVIGLDRASESDDASGLVWVRMTVEKNRHGMAGISFPLVFRGALQSFHEEN